MINYTRTLSAWKAEEDDSMRQIHQKMPPYALTAIQKAVKLASGADVPPSNVTS